MIYYSVHAPNAFIQKYWDQLLPGWSSPVSSVLVMLQPCQCLLLKKTAETEKIKDQLRETFIRLGTEIASTLNETGYLVDIFDPRSGLPLLSPPGHLQLDDVAVVRASLGYAARHIGECAILVHPDWGSAVYPSTLVSSAPPATVEAIASTILCPAESYPMPRHASAETSLYPSQSLLLP